MVAGEAVAALALATFSASAAAISAAVNLGGSVKVTWRATAVKSSFIGDCGEAST